MKDFLKRLNSHKFATYFKLLAIITVTFIIYNIYIWSITQSTDNAYVEANITYVGAEVSGSIENLIMQDNTRVKKGDIVAQVNEEQYQAELLKSEASVETSLAQVNITEQKILLEKLSFEKNQSSLELARINLEMAKKDYGRTAELSKDNFSSKKLLDASLITLEKAKNEFIQASVALKSSEQNIILLEKQKENDLATLKSRQQDHLLAKRNFDKTKILAPIDGIIANNNAKIGNYVRPGTIVFAVVPLGELYIKANFKETQIKDFKPGMKVQITLDAAKGNKIFGTIRNISPATGSKFSLIPPDNATGNFTKIVQRVSVLIDFEKPEDINIVPGMSAKVKIRT